jgi:hypothetical protein
LYKVFNRFFHEHSYTEAHLLSCGACGLWETNDSGRYSFTEVLLSNRSLLLYDDDTHDKLEKITDIGPLIIPLHPDKGRDAIINPHEVISFYISKVSEANIYHHLHKSLVHHNKDGKQVTTLCSTCHKQIVKQQMIPQLSKANGVDFGCFKRILELMSQICMTISAISVLFF